MSKLSKLKQEAYQAGKRRNWEAAVSIYERILEIDKNNPTLINELGDICLRTRDIAAAVRHFLNAASKYRSTGLLNNSVAIYKKILRHEADNLNAHWFLAEIRSSQGLVVEGERHALKFLEAGEKQTGDIKEIFLKRCEQLLEHYSRSENVLERLLGVFRTWNLGVEAGRAQLLLLILKHESGEKEEAIAAAREIVEATPDLANYPEFTQWRDHLGKAKSPRQPDVNTIDFESLSKSTPAATAPDSTATADAESNVPDPSLDDDSVAGDAEFMAAITGGLPKPTSSDADDEVPSQQRGFGDIEIDAARSGTAANPEDATGTAGGEATDSPERDDEGCFEIDVEESASFDDLMANLESEEGAGRGAGDTAAPATADGADRLEQILKEGGASNAAAADDQLSTIAAEIGHQVGSEGEGAEQPYDLGLVYLEMGMNDLASESFARAAQQPEYALRAHEMWGIALMNASRIDDAMVVLEKGLKLPVSRPDEQLGLLYHAGRAREEAGDLETARSFYERAHAIDSEFLDLPQRLRSLGVG